MHASGWSLFPRTGDLSLDTASKKVQRHARKTHDQNRQHAATWDHRCEGSGSRARPVATLVPPACWRDVLGSFARRLTRSTGGTCRHDSMTSSEMRRCVHDHTLRRTSRPGTPPRHPCPEPSPTEAPAFAVPTNFPSTLFQCLPSLSRRRQVPGPSIASPSAPAGALASVALETRAQGTREWAAARVGRFARRGSSAGEPVEKRGPAPSSLLTPAKLARPPSFDAIRIPHPSLAAQVFARLLPGPVRR